MDVLGTPLLSNSHVLESCIVYEHCDGTQCTNSAYAFLLPHHCKAISSKSRCDCLTLRVRVHGHVRPLWSNMRSDSRCTYMAVHCVVT
jgi:hypothetical protein